MRRRILIVDDDPSTRAAMTDLLEEEGFTVSAAGDGLAALEQLASGLPDLVISDLHMPRMNGEELIAKLRMRAPDLPVIVITSHTTVDAQREAVRLGVAGFVNKPIDFNVVLERIRRVLSRV